MGESNSVELQINLFTIIISENAQVKVDWTCAPNDNDIPAQDSARVWHQTDHGGVLWWRHYAQTCMKSTKKGPK